jgi:hypothetical protein
LRRERRADDRNAASRRLDRGEPEWLVGGWLDEHVDRVVEGFEARPGAPAEIAATLLETAPLAVDPPPARVEGRVGKTLVTDGPFAEAKEAIGGYSLVRVEGRAAAIELAKRYPHARWGPVEVREILSFDRV